MKVLILVLMSITGLIAVAAIIVAVREVMRGRTS